MQMVRRTVVHSVLLAFTVGIVMVGLIIPAQRVRASLPSIGEPPTLHFVPLSHVIHVAAGGRHTCAIVGEGQIQCWGDNADGQLGNGTTINSSIPIQVIHLDGRAVAITAGYAHTCALLSDGSVRCWGRNNYGQLGDGTTENRCTPVAVTNLGGKATAITAGGFHTCAILQGGQVRCWGWNMLGQLGDGTIRTSLTPVSVVNLGGEALSIASGFAHTCAVLTDGRIRCWGWNKYGQLGDGTNWTRRTPTDVVNLGGRAKSVVAGEGHTCALLEDGRVRCWGWNMSSQLGDGSTQDRYTPVDVFGLDGKVTSISTTWGHTCALFENGQVRCWGWNGYGQIGNGITRHKSVPVTVINLDGHIEDISAGHSHACALVEGEGVYCWGWNEHGQLGTGRATFTSTTPVKVVNLDRTTTAVVVGLMHSCALLTDGSVRCWGENRFGQLGNGTTKDRYTPVRVVNLWGKAKAITAGANHTCALLTDGRVRCWGLNTYGQLGDGSTQDKHTPVTVANLDGPAKAITAGANHTCALLTDGRVQCWGLNAQGQLGDGTIEDKHTPVSVINLRAPAKAIAAGSSHTCALLEDGRIQCWGQNTFGQLGNGTFQDKKQPVEVVDLGLPAQHIAAGGEHTCAVLADKSLRCWGENGRGTVGNGSWKNTSRPVSVVGLGNSVVSVAVGDEFVCATTTTPGGMRVYCWGSNGTGELGHGWEPFQTTSKTVVKDHIPWVYTNYTSGRPGSWFTLWGSDFPPNSQATLSVNGRVVTSSLDVLPSGEFMVFLHIEQVSEGTYTLSVSVGDKRAQTTVELTSSAPLRYREGSGVRYRLSALFAGWGSYLPYLTR